MSKRKIPKTIERLDAKCYTCDDIETNCADLVVPHAGISWNIVDCLCTAVIGTTGTYFTLLNCEGALSYIESCQESWNCINGNCIDPGNGLGMYTTLSACQSECSVPPSWNCINGNCIDPGDGSGTYATLSACQSECKPLEVSTWVLTGGGDLPCICEEIAGTSGQYTNEIDCLEALALDPNCCGTICSQLPTIPGPSNSEGYCQKYRQYTQGGSPNPAAEVASILNITIAEAEYLLATCCDCNGVGSAECLSTIYNTPENELWLGADPYFNSPTSFPFDDCTDLQVVSPPSNLFSIGLTGSQGLGQWLATNYPTTSTKDSKICVPIPPPNWFNQAVGTISGYPVSKHCNCIDANGNPGTWGHGISWTQTNANLGITIEEYSWSAFVNACLATGDPIYNSVNANMSMSQFQNKMSLNWNNLGYPNSYVVEGYDQPPGIGLGDLESCWCSICPPLLTQPI
jgi:hypothetical protein